MNVMLVTENYCLKDCIKTNTSSKRAPFTNFPILFPFDLIVYNRGFEYQIFTLYYYASNEVLVTMNSFRYSSFLS